jgi:hypothetical protein
MRDREVVEGVAAAVVAAVAGEITAAADTPTAKCAVRPNTGVKWTCAARLTTGARSALQAIRRRRTLRPAPNLAVGIPWRFMADRSPTNIEMSTSAEMATRQALLRIDPRP